MFFHITFLDIKIHFWLKKDIKCSIMTLKAYNILPMSTIRLTKTVEMEQILNEIKQSFPLLDDGEIIRMVLSRYYAEHYLPMRQATPEEEEAISEAMDDFKKGRFITWPADKPFNIDELLEKAKDF